MLLELPNRIDKGYVPFVKNQFPTNKAAKGKQSKPKKQTGKQPKPTLPQKIYLPKEKKLKILEIAGFSKRVNKAFSETVACPIAASAVESA